MHRSGRDPHDRPDRIASGTPRRKVGEEKRPLQADFDRLRQKTLTEP
jgi:hypothetical protein